MPEILDNPPVKTRSLRKPWTAEQAREMARRSHLPTSARYAPKPQPTQPQPQSALTKPQDYRLARVLDQIDTLDIQLAGCRDAKTWDMLTRAKERLFKAWVHLAGIPGPGNRKPAPERRQPTSDAPLQPVPLQPVVSGQLTASKESLSPQPAPSPHAPPAPPSASAVPSSSIPPAATELISVKVGSGVAVPQVAFEKVQVTTQVNSGNLQTSSSVQSGDGVVQGVSFEEFSI